MNPYGAPGGARPPPPGAPGYFSGPPPGGMPGPPGMHPPVGMPRPPPAGYAPSSFPQAPHPRPAPSTLPLPRPTARPAGPPPSLQPPGQATPPRPSAAPGPPVGKPALKAPEPVKKLMASVTFIAPSVENEFLDKLFAVFGAVKSMKRPQDPSTNVRKTFAFVEFETPESLKIALKVLPNQTIDGQDIQVKPTNPSKQYLDWWESNGRAAAVAAAAEEGGEDGEAAVDEDAAEMDATEAVMDLVAQRMGTGGTAAKTGRRSGRGGTRGDDRGGDKGGDTDALIRGVAQESNRADDRHVRLEREFEADRARKDRVSEMERRRDRKQAEDLMRQVRTAESDAARERNRRSQRLVEMRDRRQHLLKQDNDANGRDDDDDGDKWRHTARQERQREAEADEADRMRELEEEASRRGAANAAAAASADTPTPASSAVGGGAAPKGIVDMNDSIMKAMMQQVAGGGDQGAATYGADEGSLPKDTTPPVNGGWSAVGGSAASGLRLGGAAAAEPGKVAATSTKKAFFGDGSDENKPRPGAWVLEQRAKAAADAGAQIGEVVPEHAGGGAASNVEQRQAAFESERNELMQKIPTSLEGAALWPLNIEALKLDSVSMHKQLQQRLAKYVHEVIPADEDAIASEVLNRVKKGDGVSEVHEFCSFMAEDATKFTLKVWRLLIAESELHILRTRHAISG